MKRHLSSILVWIAVAVGFPYVAAMQGQPNMYGPSITADQAKAVAAPAVAEARKNQWTMAIAIVDTAGDLVYFERMDNTQVGSVEVAIAKARSAARFMPSTTSSTRSPWPTTRKPCSTMRRRSGIRILIAAFVK